MMSLSVCLCVQGKQRELRDAMLDEIKSKIAQLENASGTSMFSGRGKRKFADEDELRQKIIVANERLMNLEFVLPDDDIKADLDTISKVAYCFISYRSF